MVLFSFLYFLLLFFLLFGVLGVSPNEAIWKIGIWQDKYVPRYIDETNLSTHILNCILDVEKARQFITVEP